MLSSNVLSYGETSLLVIALNYQHEDTLFEMNYFPLSPIF